MKKGMTLDPWQKDILEHDGNVLLCTGRQVGKTTIFARKAAEYMLKHKDSRIIIVSLTEDQAKLIIIMILSYLEETAKNKICSGLKKPTQNRIQLKNGSQVRARPVGTTGDAVRGFTGDVLIIDEASRMPQLVWDSAKPTLLTTAGQIWMCSTPHGKKGYFYEAFLNKNERYKVFHISSEEVIKNREVSKTWSENQREQAVRFLEEEKRDMSELQYGQEYLGLFLEDLQQYFSDELIEKCCTEERPEIRQRDAEYYLGVDIARMGDDESAYVILKRNNDILTNVEVTTTTKTLTTQTEQTILDLDSVYDFRNIYIDAGSGSLGVGIFDHLLQNDQTKRKVTAINNRAISLDRKGKSRQRLLKEDLYDNLRMLMERGKIHLLSDTSVRLSLKSIQYEFVENDRGLTKIRIFGSKGVGGDHIAEALTRAAYASKEKNLNVWMASIKV